MQLLKLLMQESAGKGFAVVADEIRKLSVSTSSNAKNISDTLNLIVDKINAALVSSNESGQVFSDITNGINEVLKGLDEVSYGMNDLNYESGHILRNITKLNDISEQSKIESSEIQVGVKEISDLVNKIKQISGTTLDNIKNISSDILGITESMKNIKKLGVRNSESNIVLNMEVDKFKTN